MEKIIYYFIAFISSYSFAIAQNPQWINYTNGNVVFAVATENQFIWAGTYGGLVRIDTLTCQTVFYNKANSGLPDNKIISIAIEINGDAWIGTNYGLVKFDGSNWTIYNTLNSGLPCDTILSIAIAGNGNKWICTRIGGLAKFDGVNWTVYNSSNSGLPFNYVNEIDIDIYGNKWIGTGNGLAKFDGYNWTVYNST